MKSAKQYTIPTTPSYFSNVSTIDKLAVLHDVYIDDEKIELQKHFNDLYQVFMHRFSQYAMIDLAPAAEEDKLASIFVELIKTKRMLREE
ncbi:MAG: hypothetical protein V4478_03900 [Patescibacteria group bacterium]